MKDAGLEGLSSARLHLRRCTPEDLDDLAVLSADPTVMRHLGGVQTREQTAALLQGRILSYYTEFPGMGVWATMESATGALAGFHMLNYVQGEALIQVGYRLFPAHWGKGFAH